MKCIKLREVSLWYVSGASISTCEIMEYKLKVIEPYRGIKNYINAVLDNETRDMDGLWLKYAIEPFWNDWAAGQFNEQRIRDDMSRPVTDVVKLKKSIEGLEAFGIEVLLRRKYRVISEMLPPPESDKIVCIYPNIWLDQSVHGVVGTCVGENILIQINPAVDGWEKYLPWVLAHECNHTVWGYNYFYLQGNKFQDLLTSIISEGLADSFAKAVCPDLTPSWIKALTTEQEYQQWKTLQEYLSLEDNMELHHRFFFGDIKTGTPAFTGYTIGFQIVQKYLSFYPGTSWKALIKMDSREIFQKSGYFLE